MDAEFPCPHCGKPVKFTLTDGTADAPPSRDPRDMRVEDLPIKRRQALILRSLKRKGIKTAGELSECTVGKQPRA
jgi:transposase